jgi:hypothetical protein
MANSFQDDEELCSLVRAFENCEIHPAEFKHYQHLAVALWYITHFSCDEASEKMRSGIQRLAAAYGKTGYHETITIFWLRMVREFFARTTTGESAATIANRLVQTYSDKNVIGDYFSAELLASKEAKEGWVEPDLKQLGGAG